MGRRLAWSIKKITALFTTITVTASLQGCGDIAYILDDSDDYPYVDYDEAYQAGYDDAYNENYEYAYEEGYEDGYYSGRTDSEIDSWDDYLEYWDDDPYNEWDEDDWYDEDEYYDDWYYDNWYEADGNNKNADEYDDYYEPYESTGGTGVFKGDNGSSDALTGNIPVISIYVDDANCTWTDSKSDNRTFSHTIEYLDIACNYLMDEADKWGQDLNLIYDFYEDEDLGYSLTIESDSVKDFYGADCEIWYFIENSIDVGAIQKKYDADSVAIMVYVNTDRSIEDVSCTTCFYAGYALDSVYEFSYIFMHSNGEEETPAAFAHEMMHQFGAIDLYMEDEDIGLSQDEVDTIESDYPNDIMYTTYQEITWIPIYDDVTNEISELDAYYIGWTDHSDLVDSFGLMERW